MRATSLAERSISSGTCASWVGTQSNISLLCLAMRAVRLDETRISLAVRLNDSIALV